MTQPGPTSTTPRGIWCTCDCPSCHLPVRGDACLECHPDLRPRLNTVQAALIGLAVSLAVWSGAAAVVVTVLR